MTRFLRVGVQLGLLAWWYPDTFEINRHLPNLDHLFAQWEQDLFGCQPALLFSKALPGPIFSELFDMGYAAYYPMIAATAVYYFGWYYKEFNRATFIILSSFFIYYVIFIFVPVTGPTFYYKAIGLQNVTAGIFLMFTTTSTIIRSVYQAQDILMASSITSLRMLKQLASVLLQPSQAHTLVSAPSVCYSFGTIATINF